MTHAPAPPKRLIPPVSSIRGAGTPPESRRRTIQGGGQAGRAGPGLVGLEFPVRASSRRRVARSARRVRSAPPTDRATRRAPTMRSATVGDCLFSSCSGRFEGSVSAVVAREVKAKRTGPGLRRRVAQDLGQEVPAHAGDHGIDDPGQAARIGLGATGHAGDDPRVGAGGRWRR